MQKSQIFQVLKAPQSLPPLPNTLLPAEPSPSLPLLEEVKLTRDLILAKCPHPYVYHDRRRKKFVFSLKFDNKSYRKHFRCQTIREFKSELSSIHEWLSTCGITLTCNCGEEDKNEFSYLEKKMLLQIKAEIEQIEVTPEAIQNFLAKKKKRHEPSEYLKHLGNKFPELKKYLDVCANIEQWQMQLIMKTRKFFFGDS